MEEILASIRRILNDDDVPAEPTDTAEQEDDVLVLDESMLVTAPETVPSAADPSDIDPFAPDPSSADPEPEAPGPMALLPEAGTPDKVPDQVPYQVMEAMTAASSTDPREQPAPTPNLLAPETAAAAASSVGSLVRTLAAGRATQVYAGGPTLEDMVRAELRPLLKEWLDVNLPPMVERLVRAEIERVVGREVP